MSGPHATQAHDYELESSRQYSASRRDARWAEREYKRADGHRKHALWLLRNPEMQRYYPGGMSTPGEWEAMALVSTRLADRFLKSSFAETESARFYAGLARDYKDLSDREDARLAELLADSI